MIQKTATIMECSRIFSLPMTIISWLVIFVFSLTVSGNIWYGILAFAGLCFAHLGTNIIDDYIDYKALIKQVNFNKAEYLKNSQKTKCRYLINGMMKEHEVLLLCASYFGVAVFIGIILFFKCGIGLLQFATVGAIIGVLYPLLTDFECY